VLLATPRPLSKGGLSKAWQPVDDAAKGDSACTRARIFPRLTLQYEISLSWLKLRFLKPPRGFFFSEPGAWRRAKMAFLDLSGRGTSAQ
jgi:hypothetical protein